MLTSDAPMVVARRIGLRLCCLCVLVTACTTSGDDVVADDQTVPGVTTASTPAPVDDSSTTTPPTTDASTTAAPTTAAPPTDAPSTDAPDSGDDALRLAPVGAVPLEVFFWTPDAIDLPGATAKRTTIDDGPYFEVVDVPLAGIAYQRTWDADTIWIIEEAGPRELLVAGADQTLTLEGAGLNDLDQPVVYYQRRISGDPEETVSTLRRYNLDTDSVEELLVTGGWESGTGFSHISGDVAVGLNGAEGWEWTTLIDLDSGEITYDSNDDFECFDGESPCPVFDVGVEIDGLVYGVGATWNDEAGVVDAFGIKRFDPTSGALENVVDFPWDNGTWYAEDLFVLGDQLIISISDIDRQPLPGLVYDLVTGEFWSLPDAAFVRPAFIS